MFPIGRHRRRRIPLLSALPFLLALFPRPAAADQFGPGRHIAGGMGRPEAVTAADLDGDGDMDAIAIGALMVAWFENEDGQGSFGPLQIVSYDVIGGRAVIAADLDGDGDADVLSASWWDDKVAWYENTDGCGAFGPQRVVDFTAVGAVSVFAADLDGDGDQDVISATDNYSRIAWYENLDGRGDFGPPQIIADGWTHVREVTAADLDGDGDVDVLSAAEEDDTVAWYQNLDGLGTFGPPRVITDAADGAFAVLATDLNGDGHRDVLVASIRDGTVAWFENIDGLGTFGGPRIITDLARKPGSVAAADLDGDGDCDVLSADWDDWAPKVSWYENTDGLGAFGPPLLLREGHENLCVFASDLDGDGDGDVLTADEGMHQVSWFENTDGSGGFGAERIIEGPSLHPTFPRAADTGDLDGDGDRDLLLISDDGIAWYENRDGGGRFGFRRLIAAESYGATAGANADVDGDGDQDIVATSYDGPYQNKLMWYENLDGLGHFGPERIIDYFDHESRFVRPADLDGDGDLDVLVSGGREGRISWYPNTDGLGSFGLRQDIMTSATGVASVEAVDLDGDGDRDVLAAAGGDALVWYPNLDSLGTFGAPRVITTQMAGVWLALAVDLDGDGDPDVVSAAHVHDEIAWYENTDGLGSFGPPRFVGPSIGDPRSIFLTDIDGDGDVDLLAGTTNYNHVAWFENLDAAGTFSIPRTITVDDQDGRWSLEAVLAADLDGDGDADVIELQAEEPVSQVRWFANDATASAVFRNDVAGTNATGYVASAPLLGRDWMATVNNAGTGNFLAGVLGFAEPLELFLPTTGDYLLVDPLSPGGELLHLPPAYGYGQVTFVVAIPNDPALMGTRLSTQAAGFGGGTGTTLHNAYDLFVGP